ncbi:ARPP-2 domain-containing protein [Deinococcus altitudinis]|uniref:ARPP-2 domain-containing protein n=1 Tax=Deinococcus altitudinis TaxID=468914 RepID=UPI003892BC6E
MLKLDGLTPAPAQVRGAFRLVPLLRDRPCDDVRLTTHSMDSGFKVVALPDRTAYTAFVPHALLLEWDRPGAPLMALGGQVGRPGRTDWCGIEMVQKMRKREGKGGLRFLPLHLALEGLLALHFAPPRTAWKELSRDFLKVGLGSRSESGVPGALLPGFEDALKTFELHDGQVGMLVFVGEQLASAFVVPSAQDYRRLHRSLLEDLYGELVLRYAALYPDLPLLQATPRFEHARSLADLREGLVTLRREWATFAQVNMLTDLLDRPLTTEKVYEPGKLRLERFVTDLDPAQVNHVGERLTRPDGELLYLKTFQLSAAQTRRAYLLQQLAQYEWHLGNAAAGLRVSVPELVDRIGRAGFGYLLTQAVRETAAKALREK